MTDAPTTPAAAADSALTPAAPDLLQPQQMTPEVAAKKKLNISVTQNSVTASPVAILTACGLGAKLREP
jgi:hypothetical protein